MRLGIIGGGLMGLALAHKFSKTGTSIKIFEREHQLGGLATYHQFGSFFWDKFYHVILPADQHLLDFITDIELVDQLRWQRTFTGFYVNQNFYSVSSSWEFLTFPPLNIFSKIKLAFTILKGSRIKDWRKMETITAEDWLIKSGGKNTYEKFWKPLLLAKLGESYNKVSAVFIWTYIKRLFEARNSSAKKEMMGYVSGGYKTVIDRLEHLLLERKVDLSTDTTVKNIKSMDDQIFVETDLGAETFDKVIFTGPISALEQATGTDLVDIIPGEAPVDYLGVICLVIVSKVSISPYYVINIADPRVPFTGVIGMSSLVDTKETGNYHLTYFPKYIASEDALLKKSNEELEGLFMKGVFLMYPHLKREEIVSLHIHRAFKVQPLQVLNYSKNIPKATTKNPNFFVLNTSQFVNDTLNNNSVLGHVAAFKQKYGSQINNTKDTIN